MKLYIKTLGEFDLKLNDESILEASGRSYKMYRLFQYFITFKNKKLLPESIIDNLWQENESYDPKNMLRVQIYRLKQSLTSTFHEDVDFSDYLNICFNNGYYSLHTGESTVVDTDVFEQMIKNANNVKSLDINRAIDLYKSALQIYEGEYLEGSPYELWLVPIRNYFRRLYLKTLFTLIEILEEKERYEEIIILCEKALIIDPHNEAINISLMEGMLKVGNVRNALSHYEYVTSLQSNEEGKMPSIVMKDIYNRIQSQFNVKGKLQIKDINNSLEDESQLGPIFCDFTYFKFLYNLRKRIRKHTLLDLDDYVCLITLNKDYSQEEEKKHMKEIELALERSLRKGDLITLWNDKQILVLLLDSNEQGPIIIKERIMSKLTNDILKQLQIEFEKISCLDNRSTSSLI